MASGDPVTQAPPLRELTFLLTDIEGSTAMWDRDRDAASAAVTRHDEIVAKRVAAAGGILVQSRGEGDSSFSYFEKEQQAVSCAFAITKALSGEPWTPGNEIRTRAAIHGGLVEERAGTLYGSAINRCARLRALAHGGQVVMSSWTAERVREDLPVGASLLDLGVHGLRGLSRPERVFQLSHPDLVNEFPPLDSDDALRHNIPSPITEFIGRSNEIPMLTSVLADERLVTLTGVGGAGKSRLSLEIAQAVVDRFDDGVWVVELSSIRDGRLVPGAIAASIKIREEHGVDIAATLESKLRPRRLLLVLDGCEQVVGSVAALVSRLLATCPGLHVLTTTRETLALVGEWIHVVEPLPVPEPASIATVQQALTYDSIALFVQRARHRRASFGPDLQSMHEIAEICRRLDGIPLAIELAATRAASIGVHEVAVRLGDRFAVLTGGQRGSRNETLLATLDWSFDLLSPQERDLYAALSVFPGRFSLPDVEAVCDDPDALDLLQRLVDRSLVVALDAGFRLLETIRAHARTKLANGRMDDLHDRLLDHVLALAELASQALPVGRVEWLERLDLARDNIGAAQEWSLARGDVALRLVGALWLFWVWRGYHADDRTWAERVLREHAAAPGSSLAPALMGAGVLATEQGAYDAGERHFRRALEGFRSAGDQSHEAMVLNALGVVRERQGEPESAIALYDESLELHRQLGNRYGESVALGNLGVALGRTGRHDSAREYLEQCIALARSLNHESPIAGASAALGHIALAEGDIAAAEGRFRDALRIETGIGARSHVGTSLEGLAAVASVHGRSERAGELLRAADSVRAATGISPTVTEETLRQQVRSQSATDADTGGTELDIDQAIRIALEEEVEDASG